VERSEGGSALVKYSTEGEELDRAFLHPDNFAGARFNAEDAADEYILAVRGGGRGDVTDTHLLWKHPTKHTDHIVSPLVINDRIWLIKSGGIGTCFETSSGKLLWGPKRIQNTSSYFASPVYGDGKIYVAGENGVVVVLEEGPDLKVLAENDLGESMVATPALSILIRAIFRMVGSPSMPVTLASGCRAFNHITRVPVPHATSRTSAPDLISACAISARLNIFSRVVSPTTIS